jgi:tRNA-splicing ligase RtcB
LKEKIKQGEFQQIDLPEAIKEYDRTYDVDGITKQTAFLTGTDAYEYLYDMVVASTYADWNRKVIMERIGTLVDAEVLESITTTHNFIDMDDFIIRKGAVASYKDRKFILPFNSKDGILLCEGKSNPDFNYSAPHGAGRLMSRSDAKKVISVEDAKGAMDGVYASVTPQDESPLAYKPCEVIENAISPTATIIDRLNPVLNFKAN